MATAHLIYGGVGAGKTTFAKQLEGDAHALRLTHDEWMAALYGADPPADMFAEFHSRVWRLMEPVWVRALTLGIDVVLDFGFWRREERDDVRRKVAGIGAQAILYKLVCPEAEAWRRVESRNQELGGGLLIAGETFELLRGRLEALGSDEDCVTVDSFPG